MQRLLALSRAHDTLIQKNWSAANISDAVSASVNSFGMSDRFEVSGSPLELGPNATLSLAMILHELSTNAIKYGALSLESGRVVLQWQVERGGEQPELVIRWTERGGPPAIAPVGKGGFGTKLVRMGLDGTGQVKLDFAPTGLSVELRAPLDGLHRV
jgi:two-component sensor histidine kinase